MEMKTYYIIGLWALGIFYSWSYIKQLLNPGNITTIERYGCPNCDSEYQPHIKICPDCNTNLIQYSTTKE